ncbi:hypothetical protein CCACVL1_11942, partial [Corchorus capsularis]
MAGVNSRKLFEKVPGAYDMGPIYEVICVIIALICVTLM